MGFRLRGHVGAWRCGLVFPTSGLGFGAVGSGLLFAAEREQSIGRAVFFLP